MKAHAEHQQDDADLRELQGEFPVRHEAGRMRANQHAGDKVADERRNAETIGYDTEDECQPQTRDNGGDQGCVMGHLPGTTFMMGVMRKQPKRALHYGGRLGPRNPWR